ncbi:MAG: type II toxin-antitoxin system RelE family toxin [Gemmatimonadota bacterium]
MKLVFTRAAQRRLGAMSPKMRTALIARLEAIAGQPFAKHPNVERIKGETDAFRLRQGDWRAKYRIDREAGQMRVLVVEPRGSVYR